MGIINQFSIAFSESIIIFSFVMLIFVNIKATFNKSMILELAKIDVFYFIFLAVLAVKFNLLTLETSFTTSTKA